ncbi:MAG: virulence factor [Acidimicrobiales bacterium]
MSRRNRRPELVTIYWRDIPAQVNVGQGRTKQQAMLEQRFQTAIDRAAIVAGLTDTDSYVTQWRRETSPISGELELAAQLEATRLEAAYPGDRLEDLVRRGGLEDVPDPTTTTPSTASGRQNSPLEVDQ